ncbi:MAG: hypothetical protein ACREQ4_05015 [Candidatus Binataceae bacterium]
MKPGRMDYDANYFLINDNLLDLSHIPFPHRQSLGASITPENVAQPLVMRLERGRVFAADVRIAIERRSHRASAFAR